MKRLIYSLLAVTVCSLVAIQAIYATNFTAQRAVHLDYEVNSDFVLELINKYGNVNIENIDKDSLIIDVLIKTEARKLEVCKKNLTKIEINAKQEPQKISVQTIVDDNIGNFSVDYTIKMPSYLNLNLSNKYGNLEANCLFGKTNIKISYGAVFINNINDKTGGFPTIDLAYAPKSVIHEMEIGGINMSYSDIKVEKVRSIAIVSKYSSIAVEKVTSLATESAYDNLTISEIAKADINSRYTDMQIAKLLDFLQITSRYGDIKILGLGANFSGIDIDCKYTDVKIDVSSLKSKNYNLNLYTQYGSISKPKYISNGSININGTESNVYRQSENANVSIKVISKYGDIKLIE